MILFSMRNKFQRKQPVIRWILIAVGIMILPGVIFILSGVGMVFSQMAIAAWPKTTGIMLSNSLQAMNEESFSVTYEYQYEVDGVTYTSGSYSPSGEYTYGTYEDAFVHLYKEGGPVTVLYNPKQPATCYLINWDTPAPFVIIPLGLLLTALGVFCIARILKITAT